MKKINSRLMMFLIVVALVSFGMTSISQAKGNDNEQLPDFIQKVQNNNGTQSIQPKSLDDLGEANSLLSNFDSWIGPIYHVGINILTILFLAAIIAMAFAMMTKTGQWMKWASGTMIFSFISLMLLRLGPLLFLTTNALGFTLFVSDTVHLLTIVSLWVAAGMVFVGLIIRLLYKVVSNHPEYFRWSKRLFMSSILLAMLSGVIPLLFKVV